MAWKIAGQTQSEHLNGFCTMFHAVRYDGGEFQIRQRIADSPEGYKQGKERAMLIAAAPDLLAALEDAYKLIPDDDYLSVIKKARGL